jgi:type IV pilus modification protein PilV
VFLSAAGSTAGLGLTLIEILFALSVMAFALLGVAGMFPAALRAVLSGGQTTKATALAREMVEMIRGDDFSQIRTNYNNLNTNNVTVDCLSFPPNPPTYGADFNKKRWKCDLRATAAGISGQPLSEGQGLPNAVGTVIVACVNPNGTTKTCNDATDLLRRVTVTVTWENQGSKSVSLVTYVAKYY